MQWARIGTGGAGARRAVSAGGMWAQAPARGAVGAGHGGGERAVAEALHRPRETRLLPRHQLLCECMDGPNDLKNNVPLHASSTRELPPHEKKDFEDDEVSNSTHCTQQLHRAVPFPALRLAEQQGKFSRVAGSPSGGQTSTAWPGLVRTPGRLACTGSANEVGLAKAPPRAREEASADPAGSMQRLSSPFSWASASAPSGARNTTASSMTASDTPHSEVRAPGTPASTTLLPSIRRSRNAHPAFRHPSMPEPATAARHPDEHAMLNYQAIRAARHSSATEAPTTELALRHRAPIPGQRGNSTGVPTTIPLD